MKTHFYLLFIAVICILTIKSYSQTSPFNGMSIIVADVRDSITGEQISGIEIFIADSTGKIILGQWTGFFSQDTSSLYFKENPKKTNPDWERSYDPFMQIRYCFAKENYIRVIECLYEKKQVFIHINDTSSVRDTKYQTKILGLKTENFYRLSENVGIWYKLNQLDETMKPTFPFYHELKILISKNIK